MGKEAWPPYRTIRSAVRLRQSSTVRVAGQQLVHHREQLLILERRRCCVDAPGQDRHPSLMVERARTAGAGDWRYVIAGVQNLGLRFLGTRPRPLWLRVDLSALSD